MSDIKDKLTDSIFDSIFDDDDLTELKNKRIIAQKLGYKLSVKAAISCELDCVDHLEKENAQLKADKAQLLVELIEIMDSTEDDLTHDCLFELIQKHKDQP